MMKNKGRADQQEPVYQGPGVSELLRTTRERAGQDLKTVSDVLRIRYVYLDAIEEGRFNDLPGKAYVVGFVRAYADHLGLDSDEVVKRFKAEIDGLEGKAELVFPSPVTEQSIPGGAIILIGLILLGGAYGGWYFLSSQDRNVAELVPDLPAKFAEMVERVKGDPVTDQIVVTEETAPSETQAVTSTDPAQAVDETDSHDMAQKAREALEKAEGDGAQNDTTIETVKVEEPVELANNVTEQAEQTPDQAVEQAQESAQTQAVAENTPAPAEQAEESVNDAAQTVTQATDAAQKLEENTQADAREEEQTSEPEAVAEAETPAAAQVDAEAEADVEPEPQAPAQPVVMTEKVVLKAIDYAWVQVTDHEGSVVHTQVLNQGEEYQIPAKTGLILRTGNAGGLEIFVDGEKVPSVGDAGEVRRKIHLNPEKLIAGTAVES